LDLLNVLAGVIMRRCVLNYGGAKSMKIFNI